MKREIVRTQISMAVHTLLPLAFFSPQPILPPALTPMGLTSQKASKYTVQYQSTYSISCPPARSASKPVRSVQRC